ncbi:hypothetical protein Tsubulata_032758 [Turnera subulata]|uniref:HMA domain-containing protein n=1 Tax=Turnera subulata TaxID=218843 RepID=A0A9Q0GIZ5_9ROSI|nr:hypothetical protein Tsubulata_032758 [Turnera subulata]
MFPSLAPSNRHMSCGMKVDTQTPGRYKNLTKLLKKINGVSYSIDAEAGMAYITGRVDSENLLKKLAKVKKHAELCWVETGNQNSMHLQGNNGYHHQYYPAPPAYPVNNYYLQGPQPYPYYGYGGGHYRYPTWA